jgi:autotransporter-associated beta strand protein
VLLSLKFVSFLSGQVSNPSTLPQTLKFMKPKYSLVRVRASRRRFIPSILAAALAFALGVKPAQAQSGTWTGAAGTGIWGGTGTWFNNTVASGSGSTASFVGEYTATQSVAVNAARTIGNITFTDTTPSHDVNIVPHTSPFALALQVASGSPAINVTQANRTLTISNVVAGNQGLTKSGLGTLALSNTNTLTGAVVLSAGTLRASNVAGALGAGSLTLSGGTLQLANDTALNFARNTTVNANTAITSDRLTAGAGVTHTLGTLSIGANNGGFRNDQPSIGTACVIRHHGIGRVFSIQMLDGQSTSGMVRYKFSDLQIYIYIYIYIYHNGCSLHRKSDHER